MASVDWIKIKNEYINTNISQREIAEKYEVSFNTLKDRANKEGWAAEKKKQHNKITTKVQQKTADTIVESEVNRIANILDTTDIMHAKINLALEQLNKFVNVNGEIVESDFVDVKGLKMLVSSLKELSDIVKAHDKIENNKKLDEILKMIGGVI